jgi:hypothetical protein
VQERTAQQELFAEAQTTGLVTRVRRQEAQSGSERINEGQGGQKETSHFLGIPNSIRILYNTSILTES